MLHHPQAYKNSRGGDQGPQQFLLAFIDCWPMVMPYKETKAIMDLHSDQSFKDCQHELNQVCGSSQLGMTCFSFALKLILAEAIHNTIGDAIAQLFNNEAFTAEDTPTCSMLCCVLLCIIAIGSGSSTPQ